MIDRQEIIERAGELSLRPDVVLISTLGRSALAKSAFPSATLRAASLASVGETVDRPEQIRGGDDVLEGEVEEEPLDRKLGLEVPADGGVVAVGRRDGTLENGRVRGENRHREVRDVTGQGPALEELPADALEPDALTAVLQCLQRNHRNLLVELGVAYRSGSAKVASTRACASAWIRCRWSGPRKLSA